MYEKELQNRNQTETEIQENSEYPLPRNSNFIRLVKQQHCNNLKRQILKVMFIHIITPRIFPDLKYKVQCKPRICVRRHHGIMNTVLAKKKSESEMMV